MYVVIPLYIFIYSKIIEVNNNLYNIIKNSEIVLKIKCLLK